MFVEVIKGRQTCGSGIEQVGGVTDSPFLFIGRLEKAVLMLTNFFAWLLTDVAVMLSENLKCLQYDFRMYA